MLIGINGGYLPAICVVCFQLIPNGFHYFEINRLFKKNSAKFLTLKFVLFCLIVTRPYYELVNNHFFSGELQVILFIFSFISRYFDFVKF